MPYVVFTIFELCFHLIYSTVVHLIGNRTLVSDQCIVDEFDLLTYIQL